MNNLPLDAIFKVFKSFVPINEQELKVIVKRASVVHLPKKTKILQIGEVCNHMYFVISGCLRLYYLKKKNEDYIERNCFFFHEGLFCTAFGSFMMQRPSDQIMETIEDTTCLCITYDELEEIYEVMPKMNVVVRKIVSERYANAHEIIASFILQSPEQRYLGFIDKYPKLVNRIPDYHISSYLGITPKSFSRLKKRLYQKQKR
ncbi:MAG: Crp/Fnr family transcriptional regulator [Bacteroidota bacterium]